MWNSGSRGRSVALAASEGPSSSPVITPAPCGSKKWIVYLSIYLSVYLSVCLSIYLSPAKICICIYIYIIHTIFAGLFYFIWKLAILFGSSEARTVGNPGLVVTAAAEDALPILRESTTQHRRLVVVSHTWGAALFQWISSIFDGSPKKNNHWFWSKHFLLYFWQFVVSVGMWQSPCHEPIPQFDQIWVSLSLFLYRHLKYGHNSVYI